MDTISEKDTQSADDKKKEKISYIEAIPEWQALRREYRSQLLAHCVGLYLEYTCTSYIERISK